MYNHDTAGNTPSGPAPAATPKPAAGSQAALAPEQALCPAPAATPKLTAGSKAAQAPEQALGPAPATTRGLALGPQAITPQSALDSALATTPGRSRNMAAIRRTDTKPEIALRSALHRSGWRFRKDLSIRLGTKRVRPDIVFTRAKVAIFVDGCFWHCCPEHGAAPGQNTGYWGPKLQGNVDRDRRNDVALSQANWQVIRIWEHELTTPALITAAVNRVSSALN